MSIEKDKSKRNCDNKNITINDFRNKLIQNYLIDKFNINEEYEMKLYNDISIIVNYKFNNSHKDSIYESKIYTELSLVMIKDFELCILKKINEFIANKYKIDNNILSTRNNNVAYEKFINKINGINDKKDEKLFEWVYLELFEQMKNIETLILVSSFDKFLRVEKIVSNSKKNIEHIQMESNSKCIIDIIQVFYDFKDKLCKNEFVQDSNRVHKILYDVIGRENHDNWRVENGGITKEVSYVYKTLNCIETKITKIQSKDFYKEKDKNMILFRKE